MTLRKCLTAFLILLLSLPLIPLVYADGDDPVQEHPWEEVKSNPLPIIKHPNLIPSINMVYFFSVLPFHSGIFIVVVKEKSQEVVKKDVSDSNVSLPRKK